MDASPSKPADTPTDLTQFAAVLRERTHTIHREAERSGFIADLLRGRTTRRGYATYLHNLLPVYEVMERHLPRPNPSAARQAFADPALFRVAALRQDLTRLGEDRLPALPEALAYARAIEAQGEGPGLVAHAYARYLGDLSGGQILKPLLGRTLDLQADQLTVYDFPGLDITACKIALRTALDTVDVGSPDAELMVEEAIGAFRHTIALSSAVSAAMLDP